MVKKEPNDSQADHARMIRERIGPFFYISRTKQELGGVSDLELNHAFANDRALQLITSDDAQLFPTFQFDLTSQKVHPHLVPLFEILLSTGVDPWLVAFWLTAPHPEYENQRVIDVAKNIPTARSYIEAMAHEDASRWDV